MTERPTPEQILAAWLSDRLDRSLTVDEWHRDSLESLLRDLKGS